MPRVFRVLLFPEHCERHGTMWNAQSDEPWYASAGRSIFEAQEHYLRSVLDTAAIQVGQNGRVDFGACPPDLIKGPIFEQPTTRLMSQEHVNEVGMPHTRFEFYVDESEYPVESCMCVPREKVLAVLAEHGVKVSKL